MNPDQRAFLERYGPWTIQRDLGWGISDQEVFLIDQGGPKIVKCAGPANRHLPREIDVHVGPVSRFDATPPMLGADREAKILLLAYAPGHLADHVEPSGRIAEEAGRALASLHGLLPAEVDATLDENLTRSALRWLAKPTGLEPPLVRRARKMLDNHEPGPLAVSFCHGDYSPRNWLISDRLLVIDFGRSGMRPPAYDLLQLLIHPWWPAIRADFLRGYGRDLARDEALRIQRIREAITIAAWAYKADQRDFHARAEAELASQL